MTDRIGVDTGGTFTDFVWLEGDGRWRIHKQLSTPADPSQAILGGLAVMAAPAEAAVVHGSTVATNALLERRGARTALITTKGFGDVLAIGRQNRPALYALVPQKPEPLVPKIWRFEVEERVTAEGEILRPLDIASLAPILERLAADQVESVAVCLLFSFLRPEHERMIEREIGMSIPISLSSEILPEYREFERTATTVINAYVAPLMGRYLGRLAAGLAPRPLAVMQSNGGIISAATAGEQAARTVLSGPAGGVVGARFVAGTAGFEEIITFDMGGTSTDVALCPGRLPTTAEGEIAGLPLRLPMIDIHTVGAGGGSLAYVDAGGALHVGPQSAGAEPGPACYRQDVDKEQEEIASGQWSMVNGQRGLQATTTDANLVLGRLDRDHFLGGTMRLNENAARAALAGLAQTMGTGVEAAAWDVLQVANATMERAIRRISVERGYDPRTFTLVAFGGAGPLHACDLAERLQIPRVLVPVVPGVLSALGMLVAEPVKDYSQTVMREWREERRGRSDEGGATSEERRAWLEGCFEGLERRAVAEMEGEGYGVEEIELRRSLDMRYKGQSHELNIGIADFQAPIVELFHEAHERRYGYRQVGAAIEVVTIRVAAVVARERPVLAARPVGAAGADRAVIGRKSVWFGGGKSKIPNPKFQEEDKESAARPGRQGDKEIGGRSQAMGMAVPWETKLYERDKLEAGDRLEGPAVVFQYDTTTVIPPGWVAAVDGWGNLIVTILVVRP
jgi:N-methylhydantoinase A